MKDRTNPRRSVNSLFDPAIIVPAVEGSFCKLDPRILIRNPVMFVIEIVTVLTTILYVRDLLTGGEGLTFTFQIIVWLWITLLFANFAEAVAEGRGKAQAATLRKARTDTRAKRLIDPNGRSGMKDVVEGVSAVDLQIGDVVLVEAGDLIPSDGDVIEGGAGYPRERRRPLRRNRRHASPLRLDQGTHHRRAGLDLSRPDDRPRRRGRAAENPERNRAQYPSCGLTLIFVFAVATIPSFANYAGGRVSVVILVALFVTLIPTTIGALLSAIGIAGMDRLVRFNVLAMSGRAVEAAGDVDTLLLDKTGTITLGNRQAAEFIPLPGVSEKELADAAQLASLSDETPEGRSIVVLAKEKYGIRGREMHELRAKFIPFSA